MPGKRDAHTSTHWMFTGTTVREPSLAGIPAPPEALLGPQVGMIPQPLESAGPLFPIFFSYLSQISCILILYVFVLSLLLHCKTFIQNLACYFSVSQKCQHRALNKEKFDNLLKEPDSDFLSLPAWTQPWSSSGPLELCHVASFSPFPFSLSLLALQEPPWRVSIYCWMQVRCSS